LALAFFREQQCLLAAAGCRQEEHHHAEDFGNDVHKGYEFGLAVTGLRIRIRIRIRIRRSPKVVVAAVASACYSFVLGGLVAASAFGMSVIAGRHVGYAVNAIVVLVFFA